MRIVNVIPSLFPADLFAPFAFAGIRLFYSLQFLPFLKFISFHERTNYSRP
jgi:hypothetical protein